MYRFIWESFGSFGMVWAAWLLVPSQRSPEHLILGGVVTAAPAGEMLKCLPIRAMIQMAFASAEAAIRANVRKTTRERFGPIQVKKPGQWLGEPKHKGIMCDLYLLTGSNSLKQNERISR